VVGVVVEGRSRCRFGADWCQKAEVLLRAAACSGEQGGAERGASNEQGC